MRIVCLDQPTFLPGEFRARLATLGDVEVFEDRPGPAVALDRLCGADLAIVEWTPLPAELLRRVTRLRYLTLATNAFDFVDLPAAAAAGITVAHCPAHSPYSVAEHVFGLALAATRRLRAADAAVRAGASHQYGPFLGMQLRGRTLGLVGAGRTARAVAALGTGFGMRVVAANRTGIPADGLTVWPLDDVLRHSDVLSLHVPLNPGTRGLLDADRMALLKPTAILVNTCRAALIDQAALARMLADGRLAAAGLDDLAEPAVDDLRALDNVVLTPGTAWYTDDARRANLAEIYENITSYLAGRPTNVLATGAR